jgi:hypothetical protein
LRLLRSQARISSFAVFAGAALLLPSPASAQVDAGVTIQATRITTPMRLDGRLDEPFYESIPPISAFIQQDPHEGEPISERTEAWVFFDDRNLYVACRCWDEQADRIVANDMRRDSSNLRQNDNFGVFLDTFHDRRNGFIFYVTPVGGMLDGAITDERGYNPDWNTVWDAKVARSNEGWFAEIAIPFKSLRYAPSREQTWGITIRRTIRAKNEYAYTTPMRPQWGVGALFRASAAATLAGIETPPPGLNMEIKPYGIARTSTDLTARPAIRNDFQPDAGVDVKYGITKSVTADFTYNTDFAQVEADEVQVNLTRFNLQFPEKRDFFLEGQGTFTFGNAFGAGGGVAGSSGTSGGSDAPTIFYSRQIGLSAGRAVPIVAGGRVSGRSGRYSFGALNISSDDDASLGVTQTNFTVLRFRRDVLRRSTIGGLYTRRSVSTVAPGANDVFGIDGNFAFFQNVYASAYLAKSSTAGREGDDLSYRGNFNYANDRYSVQADRTVVEANFIPEVGFLPRTNFRRNFAGAKFTPRPRQSAVVRKYYYESSLNYTTDNANRLESRQLAFAFRAELQNSDVFHVEYFRDYELLKRSFEPAPGITFPSGGYHFEHLRGAWAAGQQHRLSGTAAVDVGSFYDGTKTTASLNARYTISRQLGVEPNISLNWISRNGLKSTVKGTGARTTFTLTPRMFVAALVQFASASHSFTTNFRFRWEYQPGSELFVVYSDGRDTQTLPGRETLLTRGVVIKLNKLVRF